MIADPTKIEALTLIKLGVAISLVLSSFEYLFIREQLRDRAWMSWAVSRHLSSWTVIGPIANSLNLILKYPNVLVLLTGRLLLAAVLPFCQFGTASNIAVIGGLFLTSILFALRCPYGLEGSDQMVMVLLGSLTGASFAPMSSVVTAAALWFITLQICLAYLTSGVAKARSKLWRDGSALQKIMDTAIYGNHRVSAVLSRHTQAACLINWAIVLGELLFPIGLLLPEYIFFCVLILGILVHLIAAAVMGLNNFFITFVSGYPALIYCYQDLHRRS